MDTLSHYLWTVPLYWQHPKRWLIALFGALPDLLSFGLVFLLEIDHLTGRGPPPVESLPWWIFPAYGVTHSLVICVAVLGLLWLWKPWLPFLLLGWPLHILMDIPTHTSRYFPTPIFWPLSDWTYSGFSWGTPWFLVANAIALLAVYTWLVWRVPRKKTYSPLSF